jgi:hypothetical protein
MTSLLRAGARAIDHDGGRGNRVRGIIVTSRQLDNAVVRRLRRLDTPHGEA